MMYKRANLHCKMEKNGSLGPPKSGPKGPKTVLFHVFHFNNLICPTEVIIGISFFFENTKHFPMNRLSKGQGTVAIFDQIDYYSGIFNANL